MSALIVGVDPGGTTGIAALSYAGGRLVDHTLIQTTPNAVAWIVRNLLESSADRVVLAVEKFVVNTRASRSASSNVGAMTRDLIGELTALGRTLGLETPVRPAAAVKPWATDVRLDAAGLLAPAKGMPHSRDAARHALFAAVNSCGIPDPLSRRSPRGASC